jgi:hypothetical protein
LNHILIFQLKLFVCSPKSADASGGALNVTSLTVNGGPNRESRIVLGNSDASFSIGLQDDTGSFQILRNNQPSLVVSSNGDVDIYGKIKASSQVRIDGSLNFMGVSQWLLVQFDDFTREVGKCIYFSLILSAS